MKIFFSADLHFSHANIIKYTNRPFLKEGDLLGEGDIASRPWKSQEIKQARADWMNEILINNWNNVVSKEDLVYHVGDFNHGKSAYLFEQQLNGSIVHFEGNHDRNNGVKTYLRNGMLYFGGKDVFIQHHPLYENIPKCDFMVCGHVH